MPLRRGSTRGPYVLHAMDLSRAKYFSRAGFTEYPYSPTVLADLSIHGRGMPCACNVRQAKSKEFAEAAASWPRQFAPCEQPHLFTEKETRLQGTVF